MSAGRNMALDIARSVAAFIVFFGHLFGFFGVINAANVRYFSPVATGAAAVYFFFMLSGFVLVKPIAITISWMKKRFLRLFPIYLITWLIPLLCMFMLHIGGSVSLTTVALGSIAAQSVSFRHFIDYPNPALWSLSVEIWLIPVFFVSSKLRMWVLVSTTFFSLAFLYLQIDPYLISMPFFLCGMCLKKSNVSLPKSLRRLVGWLLFIAYTIWSPQIRIIANRSYGQILLLLAFALLVLWVKDVQVPPKWYKIINFAAMRSYAFYACHLPIILFLSRKYKSDHSEHLFAYILLATLLVAATTELLFRVVEQRALRNSYNFDS